MMILSLQNKLPRAIVTDVPYFASLIGQCFSSRGI